jgi:hypothetical protein
MQNHTLIMTSHFGSIQNSRQGISNKTKKQRGDWVTLPHPPLVPKVWSNLSIDRDSR